MINYETLISSYDDKLTLMQWLKKVEDALKNSVLTGVSTAQEGEEVTFTFSFEDGTKIVSSPVKVNQQVDDAHILNGHLFIHLADGEEIDAGNLFEGNVQMDGELTASGLKATGTGVETGVLKTNGTALDVFATEVNINTDVYAQGSLESESSVKTPVLTSDEAQITAQKPIVEVMNGYSFSCPSSVNGYSLTPRYAGVCKNGNKLTLSLVLLITRISEEAENSINNTIRFYIPDSLYQQLVSQPIGGLNNLDNKLVYLVPSDSYYTHLPKTCLLGKASTPQNERYIFVNLYEIKELTLNKEYFVRIEETFLLSPNLGA